MDLKSALEVFGLSTIVTCVIAVAIFRSQKGVESSNHYVPYWLVVTLPLLALFLIDVVIWTVLTTIYALFGIAGSIVLAVVTIVGIWVYLRKIELQRSADNKAGIN